MRYYGYDYSDMHNWDIVGYPGEYVHGDDIYIGDCYMDERWLPIRYFPDYWVSNKGRIWSSISECFLYGSPTGRCGHIDVSLQRYGVRHHRYMHRLVAEAFIPNPHNYPIVRHLDDDPENNCVDNLAWGTCLDNVHDCISSGRFRYFTEEDIEAANQKRRKAIVAVDLRTGDKTQFISQREAERVMGISQASISAVILGKRNHVNGYYFYFDDGREIPIDINNYRYVRHGLPIRAIDLETGETFIFGSPSEASRELGVHISSISTILHGKAKYSKGYTFEYIDEEEYYD